jgi:hypothetical protein
VKTMAFETLRRLSQPWPRLAVSALLAVVAVGWSLLTVGLVPPRLTPRDVEMATAHTSVLVDTPRSSVVDLRQTTYSFQGAENRSILLGNVIASPPVREYIARRAQIPPGVVEIAPPLTPEHPRPTVDVGHPRRTTDILKSNNQYRLSIQANPTVPILDIYSQAPTTTAATRLANSAVEGLRSYMSAEAASRGVKPGQQTVLRQLGRAQGGVINHGVRWQISFLAFVLTFALSNVVILMLARAAPDYRLPVPSPGAAAG